MAGNPKFLDAVFLEKVGAQYLHRIGEITNRVGYTAANEQRFFHLGLTLQDLQVFFEEFQVWN